MKTGRRRPTVYDVAERAGVSIATVSSSFRRPDQVREETRNLARSSFGRPRQGASGHQHQIV